MVSQFLSIDTIGIKKDLTRMIKNFLKKKNIGAYTNSTFLALIPKESNPSFFNRFYLISLCKTSYKIITKILGNCLNPLLLNLISKNQGGFVPNRKIIDNIMIG